MQDFFNMLNQRIADNVKAQVQFCPRDKKGRVIEHKLQTDPITQRESILNIGRSKRHLEVKAVTQAQAITPREDCLYCNGKTPPTIFYIRKQEAGNLEPVVPQEINTIEMARETVAAATIEALSDTKFFYDTVVPKIARAGNLPPEPWLCRTFFNLTPALVDTQGAANCFIIGVHPDYHYCDFPDLPLEVSEAMIFSWQILETWCKENNLLSIPFVNGGKRIESGQSVHCFHSQFYALSKRETPLLFKTINKVQLTEGCSVCKLLKEHKFKVYSNDTVNVLVHPFPERNYTFLVAPEEHFADLGGVKARHLADAFTKAITIYKILFGQIPAYNIAIRSGDLVGHLHAEIIPKTNTNIPAGYEDSTHQLIITQDPADFANIIKETIPTF